MLRATFFLLLFYPALLHAQLSPEGKKEARKDLISNFFRGEGDEFSYLGVVNSFEHASYGIGPEYKAYSSYYSVRWASLSLYANYRHLFSDDRFRNAVGMGCHFTILGLEADLHFKEADKLWTLVPKIGYDIGNMSLFYGYSMKLRGENVSKVQRHQLMFKMFLYLDAFKWHNMRLKNHYYQ